jgi:hypothetical protein
LTPSPTIALQVGDDATSKIYFPKLALVATSPVVRAHVQKNPAAVMAKFVHADISREAVEVLAQWLKDVSDEADFPELPMPESMEDFMKLRLTAYTLGMERYTSHFDVYYDTDVEYRARELEEIAAVVDHTCDGKDAMSSALATQLRYLCRYHKVSEAREAFYTNLMAEEKYGLLLAAVDEKHVKAKAKKMKGMPARALIETQMSF